MSGPNGARDKLPPDSRQAHAVVCLPRRRGGAKRSRDSEVSFIEQIGGAGPRAVSPTRKPTRSPTSPLWLQRARRLAAQLISRPDKRRAPS